MVSASDVKDRVVLFLVENRTYFWLLLVAFLACAFGWYSITFLRGYIKSNNALKLFAAPILSAPAVYVVLSILASFQYCDQATTDVAAFFCMIGIILKLTQTDVITAVKLIVVDIDGGSPTEVWLENTSTTIAEARNMIAATLSITPSSRICIESGKGRFLDEPSKPLLTSIITAPLEKDLYGVCTVLCYISIRDEPTPLTVEEHKIHKKKHFMPTLMLPKNEVKYGAEMYLSGKIHNAANDAKAFDISPIELYASAALTTTPEAVRLVAWNSNEDKKDVEVSQAGTVVRDGDTVVLESGGKFMSVVRGWWISWASTSPRRSGAFTIEILEKNTTKFEQGFDMMKERVLGIEKDEGVKILRVGDVFRLRSVKFPEYEMGVTSVRIKDDYFYLGLRKIGNSSADDSWCMGLRFTLKNHGPYLLTNRMMS